MEDGVVIFENWPGGIDRCDFLVLACPLTRSNRHMVDGTLLARTKRGVRIVNVARGGLIDEQALADALASGQVAGAAIDVFEEAARASERAFLDGGAYAEKFLAKTWPEPSQPCLSSRQEREELPVDHPV